LGIVLAGLAIAAVIVLAGLVSARLIGKTTGAAPAEPGGSTDPNTLDAQTRDRSPTKGRLL
jgi:FlaG/FlaF family flagellin (archaellin)